MARGPRDATNELLELVRDGMVDKDRLIRDLVGYLSEQEVRDFCETNEYLSFDEDEYYEIPRDESYDDD